MTNYHVSSTAPSAGVCINKSRLKLHDKTITSYFEKGTVYLQDGQEFSIELFNPLSETLMAKIELNGKVISQNGLVLRPGERVYLERYLDVARKFKFETYMVSNTTEVQQAIKDNGGLKIQFYKEKVTPQYNQFNGYNTTVSYNQSFGMPINTCTFTSSAGQIPISGSLRGSSSSIGTSSAAGSGAASSYSADVNLTGSLGVHDGQATTDWMDQEYSRSLAPDPKPTHREKLLSLNKLRKAPSAALPTKSIETGRVEAGSNSNQTFEYVRKEFNSWAFHTVEFKLLPWSQKTVSSEDINVRRYCSQCGKKTHKNDKFCSVCGDKL